MADAVEHSHAAGGIHRDIKPDNVMLRDSKPDPVLIDFGLTFNRFDVEDSLTGDHQELGNRFLRLSVMPPMLIQSVAAPRPCSQIEG